MQGVCELAMADNLHASGSHKTAKEHTKILAHVEYFCCEESVVTTYMCLMM